MFHAILNSADLCKALALEREGEHLEFKEAKNGYPLEKLVDYCAAFANEGGGQMVFGVSDKLPRQVVGTSAFARLDVVKKQLFDRLHLRVDALELNPPEGRVLVFSVPARPFGSPVSVDGRYLMRVGESLVHMTPDRLRTIFSEAPHPEVQPDLWSPKGFLCGPRIRQIRADLELKPSHMVEHLGFPSERLWQAVEADDAEMTAAQLQAFAEFSGASQPWLMHGDGKPYPMIPAYDITWRKDFAQLATADSVDLQIAIEPAQMVCFLLHRRSDWRTDAYEFMFRLDFWSWLEDLGHIPEIWRMLQWLFNDLQVHQSRELTPKVSRTLSAGEQHPGRLRSPDMRRSHWFGDLFELNGALAKSAARGKENGPWFSKLHQGFQRWSEVKRPEGHQT